ncbi:hypothetical protein NQ318_020863, partial [Aromia moschata]
MDNVTRSDTSRFLPGVNWGHLKSVVFKTQPDSIEQLQQIIVQECRAISPETLQHVREQFQYRLYLCLENNGTHFEQLI